MNNDFIRLLILFTSDYRRVTTAEAKDKYNIYIGSKILTRETVNQTIRNIMYTENSSL